MKIIGIIIIIGCLFVNGVIGLFLVGSSFDSGEQISGDVIVKKYDNYGVEFLVPQEFKNQGSQVEFNVVDAFFYDTNEDDYDPVLQLNVFGNVSEGTITDTEEYKQISKKDFIESTNTSYEFEYLDGGIFKNSNGVKMYYDIVTLKPKDGGRIITEKIVTFYNRNNQIQLFWTDDKEGFTSKVEIFNKVIESIKIY